jgi:pimeloyl-ACP methyl ester carboxylesterase
VACPPSSARLGEQRKAGTRAIALDLPGHGDAALPDSDETAPWSDVLDTHDHLSANRFIMAGNSLGALVTLQTAVTLPQRVEGMTLIGYRPHHQPASAQLQAAWDTERTALTTGDLDTAVTAGDQTSTPAGTATGIRTHTTRILRTHLTRQLTQNTPPSTPDPLSNDTSAPHTLTIPTPNDVGEHDIPDPFVGSSNPAHTPNTPKPVTIPDTGHPAPLEQPTDVLHPP